MQIRNLLKQWLIIGCSSLVDVDGSLSIKWRKTLQSIPGKMLKLAIKSHRPTDTYSVTLYADVLNIYNFTKIHDNDS